MIYEEHGLTGAIAFNGAMKKAGMEVILQRADPEVTTDVICTVDTTEHDEDVLRKFAEWIVARPIYIKGREYIIPEENKTTEAERLLAKYKGA